MVTLLLLRMVCFADVTVSEATSVRVCLSVVKVGERKGLVGGGGIAEPYQESRLVCRWFGREFLASWVLLEPSPSWGGRGGVLRRRANFLRLFFLRTVLGVGEKVLCGMLVSEGVSMEGLAGVNSLAALSNLLSLVWGLREAASEDGRRRGGVWAFVALFNFPSSVNKEASVEGGEREESSPLPGERREGVWAFVGGKGGRARGEGGRVSGG